MHPGRFYSFVFRSGRKLSESSVHVEPLRIRHRIASFSCLHLFCATIFRPAGVRSLCRFPLSASLSLLRSEPPPHVVPVSLWDLFLDDVREVYEVPFCLTQRFQVLVFYQPLFSLASYSVPDSRMRDFTLFLVVTIPFHLARTSRFFVNLYRRSLSLGLPAAPPLRRSILTDFESQDSLVIYPLRVGFSEAHSQLAYLVPCGESAGVASRFRSGLYRWCCVHFSGGDRLQGLVFCFPLSLLFPARPAVASLFAPP